MCAHHLFYLIFYRENVDVLSRSDCFTCSQTRRFGQSSSPSCTSWPKGRRGGATASMWPDWPTSQIQSCKRPRASPGSWNARSTPGGECESSAGWTFLYCFCLLPLFKAFLLKWTRFESRAIAAENVNGGKNESGCRLAARLRPRRPDFSTSGGFMTGIACRYKSVGALLDVIFNVFILNYV